MYKINYLLALIHIKISKVKNHTPYTRILNLWYLIKHQTEKRIIQKKSFKNKLSNTFGLKRVPVIVRTSPVGFSLSFILRLSILIVSPTISSEVALHSSLKYYSMEPEFYYYVYTIDKFIIYIKIINTDLSPIISTLVALHSSLK